VHYFVGGATKLYGAALYRLRPEDSVLNVNCKAHELESAATWCRSPLRTPADRPTTASFRTARARLVAPIMASAP
jgi:hypothetical protein